MFATSGSASLAYDVHRSDDGSPGVLLIHAGVTDRRSWPPLIEALPPCGRVVAYDRRGYGETTYEPEPFAAQDDALAVMDAAGLERPVVVGASVGGRAAIDLALERPDRVRALVLIGAAVSGAPQDVEYDDQLAALEKALNDAGAREDLDEVNRLEAHVWLDGPAAPEGRVGGGARRLFLDMNARALAAPDPGDAARTVDAWSRLEELAMPALVIVGDLDLPGVRRNCGVLAERMPAARLLVLGGVAHLPHLEKDAACLEAVATFVGQVAAG